MKYNYCYLDINFFTHCDINPFSQYPYRYKDTKF